MSKIQTLIFICLMLLIAVFGVYMTDTFIKVYSVNANSTLRNVTKNKVNRYLDQLLTEIPDAIIARVGLIHNTPYSLSQTQMPLLRWDIVYARAAPNFPKGPGPMRFDQSLIAWSDYIEDLSNGHCRYLLVNQLSQVGSRQHLTTLGIASFDVCPITSNKNGLLLGAIFISWQESKLPTEPNSYIPSIARTATLIATLVEEISHE